MEEDEEEEECSVGMCPAGAGMKGGAQRRRLPHRDLGSSTGAGPDRVPVPPAPAAPAYLGAGSRFPCGKGDEESTIPAAPEGDTGPPRFQLQGFLECVRSHIPLLRRYLCSAQIWGLNICLKAACPGSSPGTPGCSCATRVGFHTPGLGLPRAVSPIRPVPAPWGSSDVSVPSHTAPRLRWHSRRLLSFGKGLGCSCSSRRCLLWPPVLVTTDTGDAPGL